MNIHTINHASKIFYKLRVVIHNSYRKYTPTFKNLMWVILIRKSYNRNSYTTAIFKNKISWYRHYSITLIDSVQNNAVESIVPHTQ